MIDDIFAPELGTPFYHIYLVHTAALTEFLASVIADILPFVGELAADLDLGLIANEA